MENIKDKSWKSIEDAISGISTFYNLPISLVVNRGSDHIKYVRLISPNGKELIEFIVSYLPSYDYDGYMWTVGGMGCM